MQTKEIEKAPSPINCSQEANAKLWAWKKKIIILKKLCKDLTSAMDQIKGARRARMSGRSPEGKFGRGVSGVV